jgi:hypothetical protein
MAGGSVKFEVNIEEFPALDKSNPGDEVTIRAFVQSVTVEAIDVTAYGQAPQVCRGPKYVELVILEVRP